MRVTSAANKSDNDKQSVPWSDGCLEATKRVRCFESFADKELWSIKGVLSFLVEVHWDQSYKISVGYNISQKF